MKKKRFTLDTITKAELFLRGLGYIVRNFGVIFDLGPVSVLNIGVDTEDRKLLLSYLTDNKANEPYTHIFLGKEDATDYLERVKELDQFIIKNHTQSNAYFYDRVQYEKSNGNTTNLKPIAKLFFNRDIIQVSNHTLISFANRHADNMVDDDITGVDTLVSLTERVQSFSDWSKS